MTCHISHLELTKPGQLHKVGTSRELPTFQGGERGSALRVTIPAEWGGIHLARVPWRGDALVVMRRPGDIRHIPLIVPWKTYQMAWNSDTSWNLTQVVGTKTWFWNAVRHDLLNAGDSIMKSLGVVCDIWVSVYKIRGDLPSGMMVSVATFSPWLARDWTWKNHIPKGCFFWGGRGYPMMTEVSKVSHRLVTWSK